MKKILFGVLSLVTMSCSSDDNSTATPTSIPPTADVIQITKNSLPTSYLNSKTYTWDLINATYIPGTSSTIYAITQRIDFNFFNTDKAKSKTLQSGGTTYINPVWDKFYTVIEVNLIKKINLTQNTEIIEQPTYNKAGYPMTEIFLREDSNGNIHYYTLGSDNKLKTQ